VPDLINADEAGFLAPQFFGLASYVWHGESMNLRSVVSLGRRKGAADMRHAYQVAHLPAHVAKPTSFPNNNYSHHKHAKQYRQGAYGVPSHDWHSSIKVGVVGLEGDG
jgi:hypothetical protein